MNGVDDRKKLGAWGEAAAAAFLEARGIRIVEENYRCRLGEVDLVGKDGECWVFAEVKTRRSAVFGRPCEAVNVRKQRRLRRIMEFYCLTHDLNGAECRMDVVEVLRLEGKAFINHLPAAF